VTRLSCLLLLPLLACKGPQTAALSWRESWEVLVPARDGSLVDARIVVSNTGLLRGQGHLRFERWTADEAPIIFARDAHPAEVRIDRQRGGVRLGNDGLVVGADDPGDSAWTFISRNDEAEAFLRLAPDDSLRPTPVAWQEGGGQWTLDAPVVRGRVEGFLTAGDRGGQIQGYGVVLHRGGDGQPALPRTTLVVSGQRASIGLDHQGQGALSWAWVEGEQLDTAGAELVLPPHKAGRLRFANGLEVELRRQRRVRGLRLPYEHLLGIEQRILAATGGWVGRRVQRLRTTVHWRGESWPAPGVLVQVQAEPWAGTSGASPESALPGDASPGPSTPTTPGAGP